MVKQFSPAEQQTFATALEEWLATIPDAGTPWALALLAAAVDECATLEEALSMAKMEYDTGPPAPRISLVSHLPK